MPLLFTCDENGNGTFSLDGLPPFVTFNGSLQPDPSWPGNPLRLTWDLASVGGAPVGRGDLNILETDDFTLSDVLRFTDAAGSVQVGLYADRMILYSNLGGGKLADTGFPPNLNSGVLDYCDETVNDTWEFIADGGNTYRGVSNSDAAASPITIMFRGIKRVRKAAPCEPEPQDAPEAPKRGRVL